MKHKLFEIDLGWQPKSSFDFISGKGLSNPSVKELQQKLKASFGDAKFAHRLAKARFTAHSSRKYQPLNYSIGDQIWLSRKYFTDAVPRSQI